MSSASKSKSYVKRSTEGVGNSIGINFPLCPVIMSCAYSFLINLRVRRTATLSIKSNKCSGDNVSGSSACARPMYSAMLGIPLAVNWPSLRTKYATRVCRSFNELFTGVAVNNITFLGCSPQSSFITASARNVFALRKL